MGILRSLFGPSQEEIWSQIASEIGGDFITGGFWEKSHLRYQHGEWEILLDTYTVSTSNSTSTYTRMRAPFINKDGLYFRIYREGIFSNMGKFFGMQDIEIGDEFFDESFVIKGNDHEQITRLLQDEKIKSLLWEQPHIHFEIQDDEGWFGPHFEEDVDQLYFRVGGVLKDTQQLRALFELFARVLNRLVAIDSAYHADPGIQLD